jgi:predicted Zn-dependent peptidase
MIRREVLPNGLTLLVEPMPEVRSISLGIWLKRGSRHETPSLNGASHFLEHLVFKGTERRSAREIALLIDSIGGQIDAFTSKEYTCFYAKVLDEHLGTALDILSDVLRHPRFDPEDIERERQVIFEEIRMVNDSPDEHAFDLFCEAFWPNHALGRPIQGTEASVAGLSRQRLVSFFRRSYTPANLVVSLAGHLPPGATLRRLRRTFGALPRMGKAAKSRPPRPRAAPVLRQRRDLEQLHLILGVPGPPETHRSRYVLHVLNTILGSTVSGRLFQRIREQNGLAYNVHSSVNGFSDAGVFLVYAATRTSQAPEVVRLVVEELRRLMTETVGDEEIRVAKDHLKGSLMLALESTSARMANLARHEIYRRRAQDLDAILASIEAVSARSVRGLARRLFADRRPAVAALGPLGRLPRAVEDLVL